MGNWFKKFVDEQAERFPWIVKFEGPDGKTQEVQVAGENAQEIADYIRETYGATIIYFVAKLDNSWE